MILGASQILRPAGLGVNGSWRGPETTIPGSLELRKEYIGYMVHWIADDPLQLAVPHKEVIAEIGSLCLIVVPECAYNPHTVVYRAQKRGL